MIVKIGSLDVEAEGVVVVAAPAGHAGQGGGGETGVGDVPSRRTLRNAMMIWMLTSVCFFCASVNASMTQLGGATALSFFFLFSLISLIADGPHHNHPACGHKRSSHLSPVHALQFFIAIQVQHSCNSSIND